MSPGTYCTACGSIKCQSPNAQACALTQLRAARQELNKLRDALLASTTERWALALRLEAAEGQTSRGRMCAACHAATDGSFGACDAPTDLACALAQRDEALARESRLEQSRNVARMERRQANHLAKQLAGQLQERTKERDQTRVQLRTAQAEGATEADKAYGLEQEVRCLKAELALAMRHRTDALEARDRALAAREQLRAQYDAHVRGCA